MTKNQQPSQTLEERRQVGRALRDRVKRTSHAAWDLKLRTFDVIELLKKSNRERIARLLPIKYARMAVSPFGFFRGAVPVMAADLAQLPSTGLMTQICGDAHVQNLGSFQAADGRVIFDINDFDETALGHWEWDVKRMCASLVLAGREAGNSDLQCETAVMAFVNSYRRSMRRFATMPVVDLALYQLYRPVSPIKSVLRKAERATPLHNLQKLTEFNKAKGTYRFREQRPTEFHIPGADKDAVIASLGEYTKSLSPERAYFFSQYKPVDVVFRVVGTGSVGTRDYVLLMFASSTDDPLFLQVKEEPPSSYAPYLPAGRKILHQGERVTEGQRAMQMQSDIFLGWTSIADRDYVVRQLRDHKAGIEPADLKGNGLLQYARVVGELLSKGHARSGDPCALAGYLGNNRKFDGAMRRFSVAYANQTHKDWEALRRAIRTGKLKAATLARPPSKKATE